MKTERALFLSICVFLLSAGVCVVTLFNLDPRTASVARIIMFFAFMFIAVASAPVVYTLLRPRRENQNFSVKKVVRRASFVSFGVIGLIFMSSFNILNLLSAVAFILAVIFGELFIEGRSSQHHG